MEKRSKRRCPVKLLILAVAASLMGVVSCESDFLLSNSPSEDLFVETSVRSGGILSPDEEIDLTLVSQEGGPAPQRMEVEVFKSDGTPVESFVLDEPLAEAFLPSVSLQDQEEGLYFLHIGLYGADDELMHEQELPLFLSESNPVIERLETFPPSALHPNGGGVVIPRVTMAENGWARWLVDGEELEAGPLSRYADGFVWNAPAEEGVYSIVLEVYPFPPPEEMEDGYDFSAPVSGQVQFYVRENAPPSPQELQMEKSYLHLLHFRGSLEDEGTASAPFRFIGDPSTGADGGLYGYALSPGEGIEGSTPLLPPGGEGIDPFSLSLVMKIDRPDMGNEASAESTDIVSVITEEGDTFMNLSIRDNGAPSLDVSGMQRRITASDIDVYRLEELTVSVIPYGEGAASSSGGLERGEAAVKWYADGEMVHSFVVEYRAVEPPADAVTIIGGERGFTGVIDELGVFYRDSEGNPSGDEDVFRRNALRMLGEDELYFAEGYENGGNLFDRRVVSSASDNTVVELDREWEELTFNINTDGSMERGGMAFSDDEGELFTLPLLEVRDGDSLTFTLVQDDESIVVYGRENSEEIIRSDREKRGNVEIHLVPLKTATENASEAMEEDVEPEDAEAESMEEAEIVLEQLLITRSASGLADER
ncbi:MAG: hypothetical protein ACLFSA_04345 [Spirochaetaceae bacterium]